MPDPQTPNKFLFTPAHNADIDTWDVPVNANWNGLDQALGTYTHLNATGLSGTVALTTSQVLPLGFIVAGTPTGPLTYTTPASVGGLWLVRNRATLSGSITLGFASASGGPTVNIPAATNIAVSADGTANGMVDIDTIPGFAGGSNTQVQVNIAGVLGGYAGFTFDGTTLDVPNVAVAGNATVAGTATGGTIDSTTGGYVFPDATTSTTANGKVLQLSTVPVNSATSSAIFTGVYPLSGAAPTTAGGVHVTPFDLTFTPHSPTSTLEIDVRLKGVQNTGSAYTVALFNGSTLLDYEVHFLSGGASNGIQCLTLRTWVAPGAITPIALKVYIGATDGGSFNLNSFQGAGAQPNMISWLAVKEIQPGGP